MGQEDIFSAVSAEMEHDSEEISADKPGRISLGNQERYLIRHMPYFVTVAEEEHFHRAAARLNITQPALSRRIQGLEQEMGLALFERSQRSVRLTAAGEVFHRDVQRILRDMSRAIGRARSVTRGEAGHLHLALNQTSLRSEVVTEGLQKFRKAYPQVIVNLTIMASEAQPLALENEEIDSGFLNEVAIRGDAQSTIELLPIAKAPYVLVLRKDHPLAARERLRIADLRDEPLTLPSRASGRALCDEMIAAFRAVGESPNVTLEIETADAAIGIAAANLGVGFIVASQLIPNSLVTRHVEDFNVSANMNLAWMRSNQQPALRHFADVMREQVRGKV